jgi:hypothetical protein
LHEAAAEGESLSRRCYFSGIWCQLARHTLGPSSLLIEQCKSISLRSESRRARQRLSHGLQPNVFLRVQRFECFALSKTLSTSFLHPEEGADPGAMSKLPKTSIGKFSSQQTNSEGSHHVVESEEMQRSGSVKGKLGASGDC